MDISADKTKKILEFGPVSGEEGRGFMALLITFIFLFILLSGFVIYTYYQMNQFRDKVESGLKFELNDSKVSMGSNIKGVEERVESLEKLIEPISLLDPKYTIDQSVRKLNSEIWHINEERFNNVETKINAMTEELVKARESIESGNKRELLYISLISLLQKVNSTFPFQTELQSVSAIADNDNVIIQNLSFLKPYASSGIPSISDLQNDFSRIAGKIVKSPDTDIANKNVYEKIVYNISNSFVLRKTGFVEGESREAIVARTEDYLRKGNLNMALQEIEKVGQDNSGELYEWLERARSAKQSEIAFINIMKHLSDNSLEKISHQNEIGKNTVTSKDVNG